MNTDNDELHLLRQARKLLSPTPADAERVWQAARAEIAAQPVRSSVGETALRRPTAVTASLWSKWIAGCAIALVSGAVGFYAGLDRGRRQTADALPDKLGQPAHVAPAVPLKTPAHLPTLRASIETPAFSASDGSEPPVAARSLKRAQQALAHENRPSASPVPAALTLAQEVEILKRVERALRDGEPGTALELLDDLEQRGASTMLAEERLAATIMARCGLGLGVSEQLLAQLNRQYPSSMYQARVEHACSTPRD